MHNIPVQQTAPKLIYYYSNAYSRIGDSNSSIKGTAISDGIWTNRQQTTNLRGFFPPYYGQCFYSTTGHFCNTLK